MLRSIEVHARQFNLVFSKSAFGKSFLHRSHILLAIIFVKKFFIKKTIPYHAFIASPRPPAPTPDPDPDSRSRFEFIRLEPCFDFYSSLTAQHYSFLVALRSYVVVIYNRVILGR
jgi:hypothetical protein